MKKVNREGRMSSLNINKRGNNMKKTLIVLITAVLAISMLFVSCSNEANLDERVSVQFITPHSRSLSASVSADPETLVWHYSATKKSLTEFNYGATQDSIVGKDNAGNFYSIELSQGLWDFELWAVVDSVEYYRGNTKGVLIEKKSDNTPVPISIVVSPFGGTGKLEIKDVVIAKKTTNGFANTTYVPNTVSIKKDGNVISQNPSLINGACEIANLNTGSYDITLSYVEGNINVASAKITVVVYSGRTTTVSGTIEETTSSGQFKVNVQKNGNSTTVTTDAISDVSSAIPITDRTDTSPATVSVIVPENTVTSGSTLIVEKKITEQPSTVNVTAGNGATFYDVKLQQVKDGVTTDFVLSGDNYFTVELYVGQNLDIVNFKHHDTPLRKVNTIDGNNQYTYNSGTGYVTFTTSSFSPFTAEYKFGGGLGTKEAPYLIYNIDQFLALNNISIQEIDTERWFELKADIDLSGLTPSTSYLIKAFGGTLDGKGHTITGNNDLTYIFAYFVEDTTIKNLNMVADNENLTILFGYKLIRSSYEGNKIPYSKEKVNITFSNVDYVNTTSHPYKVGDSNWSFYYNDNTSLCYLYKDGNFDTGWMEDLRKDGEYVHSYYNIEDCDIYGNYYGGFSNSGAAIFNGGQIYGGHLTIKNSNFFGTLKGERVSLVMANYANFQNNEHNNENIIVLENVKNNGTIMASDSSSNLIFSNKTIPADIGNNLIVGSCIGADVQRMDIGSSASGFEKDNMLDLSSFNDSNKTYEIKLSLPSKYWFIGDSYVARTDSNTFAISITNDSQIYCAKVLSTSDLEDVRFAEVKDNLINWNNITTTDTEGTKYQFVTVDSGVYLVINYESDTYKYYYSKNNTGPIDNIRYLSKAIVFSFVGQDFESFYISRLN